MSGWVAGEQRREAEYHGERGGVDTILCPWCGRDEPWPEWWSASGPDGPLKCPGCGEPKDGR